MLPLPEPRLQESGLAPGSAQNGTHQARLFLRGIEAYGWHGVFEDERKAGQRFIVDVAWTIDPRILVERDTLESTVCYKQVFDLVTAMIEGEPWHLIETLADKIASRILAHFPAANDLEVVVHKPDAPLGGKFADVGVTLRKVRARQTWPG